MCINKNILEFKQKFILDNLERIKMGLDRVLSNSDSVKKWTVTIWFATLALSLKEVKAPLLILNLLIIEVLLFYFLDSYFMMQAKVYGKRIDSIERWIMKAKPNDILELEGPLADIGNKYSKKERVKFYFPAMIDLRVFVLYAFLLCLSIIIVSFVLI